MKIKRCPTIRSSNRYMKVFKTKVKEYPLSNTWATKIKHLMFSESETEVYKNEGENMKRRKNLGSCVLDKQHVKDALTSLKICLPKAKAENLMKKKCGKEDIHFSKGSAVVTPFSHTYVMLELRKCFLRHDWIAATKLLLMLLDGGSVFLKKVMLKSCMYILLNHPRASLQHRQEFIRMCSGVVDADELLKCLLTFPSDKKHKHSMSYCAPL